MNISGVVVTTASNYLTGVVEVLNDSDLCEVHFTDDAHKIIVTLDGESVADETSKLRALQQLDHVISAEMVFSYNEDELDQLRENVESTLGQVPDVLNNPLVRAGDINYRGHG